MQARTDVYNLSLICYYNPIKSISILFALVYFYNSTYLLSMAIYF